MSFDPTKKDFRMTSLVVVEHCFQADDMNAAKLYALMRCEKIQPGVIRSLEEVPLIGIDAP